MPARIFLAARLAILSVVNVTFPLYAQAQTAPAVVATADLDNGSILTITELRRTSGDTVTLKFVLKNNSTHEMSLHAFGSDILGWDLREVALVDIPNKRKYLVLKDSKGVPLSSRGKAELPPDKQVTLWAKFPAPPASVSNITVVIPRLPPFDDLPIAPQS